MSSDKGEMTKTSYSALIWMGFSELQLNWSFCGDLNLYPVAWYEPRNWSWQNFIMDQTLALNQTIGELMWGPKTA